MAENRLLALEILPHGASCSGEASPRDRNYVGQSTRDWRDVIVQAELLQKDYDEAFFEFD